MSDLDLPDGCWTTPIGDLEIGDVCEAVPFAALSEDRITQMIEPDDESRGYWVPVVHSYGMVAAVFADYAVLAAIGTSDGVGDEEDYSRLVEAGRHARAYVRLPALLEDPAGGWSGRDGVAILSHVETFGIDYELLRRRVATMSDSARELVRRRIARALEYY